MKIFIFLVVKFSIYLNRRVFVMPHDKIINDFQYIAILKSACQLLLLLLSLLLFVAALYCTSQILSNKYMSYFPYYVVIMLWHLHHIIREMSDDVSSIF